MWTVSHSDVSSPQTQRHGRDVFKLFHLNSCPPTKADSLKTARKLVPVLRSNYSSAGKIQQSCHVLFYTPLPSSSHTFLTCFKVHHTCSCLMQWLIIKSAPHLISTVSVVITQQVLYSVNRDVQLGGNGANIFFLLN